MEVVRNSWSWLASNKEWVFSGLGVKVISVLFMGIAGIVVWLLSGDQAPPTTSVVQAEGRGVVVSGDNNVVSIGSTEGIPSETNQDHVKHFGVNDFPKEIKDSPLEKDGEIRVEVREESTEVEVTTTRPRSTGIPQDCPVCPEMVIIPSGEFQMGSPDGELGRDADEHQHQEIISTPFAIGKYEVTFEQYDAFAQETGRELPDDDGVGRGRHPVFNVSWTDAVAYSDWLSKKTGKPYRLPTEIEWEYAARAGVSSSRPWSADDDACEYANVYDVSIDLGPRWNWRHDCPDGHPKSAPVGSYAPNGFGLFDVLGNVWEWTQSCWSAKPAVSPTNDPIASTDKCEELVIRGGSWRSGKLLPNEGELRFAERQSLFYDASYPDLGFRIALTLKTGG